MALSCADRYCLFFRHRVILDIMANTPHPSPHKVVANGSHLPQLPRRTDHAYTTLADRLGVPRGTLKDWMRGKYPIAYEFRPAIISFLREQMAATRQLIDYVQNAPLPAPKIRGVAAKAQQGKTKLHKDL